MKLSKININLLFLIVTAILFQIFLFMQKDNFHIDEMFSFVLANNNKGMVLFYDSSEVDNKVLTGEYLNNYITKHEGGSFFNTWQKVSQDNHMPLYFILLRAFNIFDNTTFNPLSGILLNVVVLIFLLIGFYKLAELVFKSINIATVVTGIFAFSQAVLSLEIYIRMYLLLMTFSVWLVYFIGKYFLLKKHSDLFFVLLLTFLTILTHYYSLIFCFLIASFVCLYFLLQKDYKNMFLFGFTMLFAVIIAYFAFPTMIETGFHGERGSQFWLEVSKFKENPLSIIKEKIPLFVDTIFINFWFFVSFAFLYLFCCDKNRYVFVLFFVFVSYGFLTTLIMPVMLHYQIRYFAPIISIFILLMASIFINFANKYNVSQKSVYIFLCLIMFFTGIKNIIWQDSPFYMHGTRNSRKMENLIKGADVWWGFGGGWQYAWMIHLYIDKLAKADKTWILADYYHPEFIEFSNQEVKDKKYAYLFMPKTQEQSIEGGINWIKKTTGRTAYYLFTSKSPNTAAMVLEASVYLVCPY